MTPAHETGESTHRGTDGLLATFLGAPDEPNARGEMDLAAWRFVLPRRFDTIEWRWEGPGHAADAETMAAYATVLRPGVDDGADDAVDGRDDRLVVGPGAADDLRVGIDFGPATAGRRLEFRYVGDELQGIAPLDDERARAVLRGYVGADGPVPRSLKQRLQRKPRRTRRTEVGSLRGVPAGPPAWLVVAAAEAGIDIAGHGWALWCRGAFGSQKLIMFLLGPDETRPSAVVKIVREPRFNDRLANESKMLRFMEGFDTTARGGAPALLFHTTVWGSAASAQSAVHGTDLRVELPRRPGLLADVTSWMIELARASRTEIDPGELRDCLELLVDRYVAAYEVPPTTEAFLRRQAALLDETGVDAVAQHGDAGPWNALLTEAGGVAFLDWEAGETRGLPLWDLLYFHRSASLLLSPRRPWQDRRRRLRRDLIEGSPVGDRFAEHVRSYVEATGIDRRAVEPLYHLCWVQRAVKEARRLPPARRSRGVFHRFVLDGVEGRDRPGLRRITLRDETRGEDPT